MENNNYKKTKNIVGWTGISILIIFFISCVVIAQLNKPQQLSTGDYFSTCRNTCESVGWDDRKFNDILNKNDGLSNLCDSYSCSENRPSYNPTVSPIQGETFYGYDCKGDCSGHTAGYNWAQSKNILDSSACGGNSNSFIEGCKAYVQEENNFGNGEY